jgi:hypothetical protein
MIDSFYMEGGTSLHLPWKSVKKKSVSVETLFLPWIS